MATPDFIRELRRAVGHAPLWLTGVTALVLDPAQERTLVVRRADTGAWTPVTGIVDPGEEPAIAGAREVLEEAGIVARPVRLVDVRTQPPLTYSNGDRAQFLNICFLYTSDGNDPYPADGENTEARWAALDDLPPVGDGFRAQLAHALSGRPEARFRA